MNPQLEWTIASTKDTLTIQYTVRNPGPTPIWLVDDVVVWGDTAFKRAPHAVIVRDANAAGTVSFYRGMMYLPSREMRRYPSPGVREVSPGGEVQATLHTPLPLAAWHYHHPAKMPPLSRPPERAILEVQYLTTRGDDGERDWGAVELEDGSTLRYPHLRFLEQNAKLLTTEPRSLNL